MKRTWLKNYYSRHEIEPSSEAYIKKTVVYIGRCQILMMECL